MSNFYVAPMTLLSLILAMVSSAGLAQDAGNQPPRTSADNATVAEGGQVTIDVLSNDTDGDGTINIGSVDIFQPNDGTYLPANGWLQIDSSGRITFTHYGGSTTSDMFYYIVADNDGAYSAPQAVNIAIGDSNQNFRPQANNDTAIVDNDESVTIRVLNNDSDADGNLRSGSVSVDRQPSNGSASVQNNGTVLYTHNGGSSSDSFSYTVEDNTGLRSNEAIVTVSVNNSGNNPGPNQPPRTANDSATVAPGAQIIVNVLSNDIDIDGTIDTASVDIHQPQAAEYLPQYGWVQIQSDGRILYSHYGGEGTSDSIYYTVADNDGAYSSPALLNITIGSGNATGGSGTGGNVTPQANNDSVQVTQGNSTAINVLANDRDSDGTLNIGSVAASQGRHGVVAVNSNGRITYLHGGGSASTDSFTYTVSDNDGAVSNTATVTVTVLIDDPQPPVSSGGPVTAFHRDGQSFLTWSETGSDDRYHVYRHSAPITAANLRAAQKLTTRWGPLGSDTSVNVHAAPGVPQNFVINSLGQPLNNNTALFVYTTQPGDSARAYYAVTSVNRSGTEAVNSPLTTSTSLSESQTTPSDVLTVSVNQGKGRIYTQYMDYVNWNPTFNGYAYNYTVALPANYNRSVAYPLMIELHAYGENLKTISESEYQWPVITLLPHDPGAAVGAVHSWWYGYSRDHNYNTDGDIPRTGAIANFTEQRIMRSIGEIIDNPDFNVEETKIHGFGNSMGASGILSLALRYGSVISGVYANQPMTNYANTPVFTSELLQLWGTKNNNLPIVNSGLFSEGIRLYGQGGAQSVGVWDWVNHHKQVVDRRGDEFAFVMTYHGKQDRTIDWATQGRPTAQAFSDATMGHTAINNGNAGHSWAAFASVNTNLFGFGNDQDFPWKYPLTLSFPAIANASSSSSTSPGNSGNDSYNLNIEWATPHTPFAPTIVDTPGSYEISLRSTTGVQTADITPRRTQRFSPNPGSRCSWSATDSNNGRQISTGTSNTDQDSLLTVRGVEIVQGAGTRLSISCANFSTQTTPSAFDNRLTVASSSGGGSVGLFLLIWVLAIPMLRRRAG